MLTGHELSPYPIETCLGLKYVEGQHQHFDHCYNEAITYCVQGHMVNDVLSSLNIVGYDSSKHRSFLSVTGDTVCQQTDGFQQTDEASCSDLST